MTTGEKIKELRTKAGVRQSELAEAIGCTGQVISNIERGYTSLSLELLVSIANFLHVSTDYLLGKTDWHGNELAPNEEILLDNFRSSSEREQQIISGLIKDLILKEKNNVFTRATGGRAPTRSESCRKGWCFMSTYEELMVILTAVSLIVSILAYTHKK